MCQRVRIFLVLYLWWPNTVTPSAIIVFALSSATSNFYTGSRIIHGLALDGQAPAIFKKITTAGRPTLAIVTLTVFCFLSYIGHDEGTEGAWFRGLRLSDY